MKPYLHNLTVFIISTGEDTEHDCRLALQAQNCHFTLSAIRNVAPMSAAFQSMPDSCETKYFAQVDADMILDSNAINLLYQEIRRSPIWIYRVSASLYEEGFGVGGAVKCWKNSIFRFARFRDVRTVDRDLAQRLRRFGLLGRHIDKVVGTHRPRHSNFSFYLKTKSDIEKWRYLMRPCSKYALPLMHKILSDDIINRHRVLGALLGTLTSHTQLVRSKNIASERLRFSAIINALKTDQDLTYFNQPLIQQENFLAIFSTVYDDFDSNSSINREKLAKLIANVFCSRDNLNDVDYQDILDALEQ